MKFEAVSLGKFSKNTCKGVYFCIGIADYMSKTLLKINCFTGIFQRYYK